MVTPYRVRPRFSFKAKTLAFVCEILATDIFSVVIARITASDPSSSNHPTLKEWLLQHARLSWEVLDLLQGEAER
jgi:hypothetical protein